MNQKNEISINSRKLNKARRKENRIAFILQQYSKPDDNLQEPVVTRCLLRYPVDKSTSKVLLKTLPSAFKYLFYATLNNS